MDDSATHDFVGYVVCPCGENLVLRPVAVRTGGLCSDCFAKAGNQPLRHIEVIARGARLQIPLRPRKPRGSKNESKESKARQKIVEKCKDRARKRVAAVFSDLYDIFLAEERANAGLEPWPLGSALDAGPDPDGATTQAFAELYHQLGDRGVNL